MQQEVLGDCMQQLPNMIDACGMGVQDSPDIQEILDVVVGGVCLCLKTSSDTLIRLMQFLPMQESQCQ
ncbi:hypothetical protein DPMN_154215 [Dreissena polymorpha]|uniref:Uncharacterized protein n=1 Tax=Dreissena polymorpha TaxID=45954 RepID=A0A9D4FM71_DREPO|nr:hypothetical protein DPMN_154215 [Dreissena polymorpha]